MLKRFAKSAFGRLFFLFFVISTITFIALTKSAWDQLVDETYLKMSGMLTMVQKSAIDRFSQQEAMFKILGQRILEAGGLNNIEKTQRIMDGLLQDNPVFIAYGIAAPDGQLEIISINLRNKKLPNLLQSPHSADTFKAALQSEHLTLGRTYFFNPLQQWIIPLRYAVRNSQGEVKLVITTGIALDGDYNPWDIDHLEQETDIHIPMRVNQTGAYYPLYFSPFDIFGQSKQEFYANPLSEVFINTAIQRLEEASGKTLEEIKQSGIQVGYINDTPGIEPAYTLLSYDSKYNYFIVTRKKISFLNQQYNWVVAKNLAAYLLLNILILGMLFRFFQSDENYKGQLKHQALHDQLTDLPNRYYLKKHSFQHLKTITGKFALLFLDMDNFKVINDHYGHSIGDRVLVELSNRLKEFGEQETVIVRHGGDEFVFLMPFSNEEDLVTIIEKIIYRIHEVIVIDNINVSLTGSIGVAICDKDINTLDNLMKKADLAMYQAKKVRNNYAFFSQEMDEKNEQRAVIENELHSALKNNEMFLVYQPQIDSNSGIVFGVEALLRWNNRKLGFVSPETFIAIAENCGQINAVGRFVVETAIQEISALQQPDTRIRLSINVSVQQLLQSGFRSHLLQQATDHGIEPRNITIEITESLFIEDFRRIKLLLVLLNQDGFVISLDDFGTGYSALSILRSLPLDEIKIDKSFVRDILIDKQDESLIKSIISIGKSLDIPTLAEGVETIEQAKLLKQYGCRYFQGYYFARPMNIEELENYISTLSDYEI